MEHDELPLGFAMALAQYPDAMERFTRLTKPQKNEMLQKAHAVSSKDEMQALVSRLSASD